MITEELGLQLVPASPVKAAWTTFLAFMMAGLVPLVPLFFSGYLFAKRAFTASTIATALTFLGIGLVKGRVVNQPLVRSALETLLVGGCAAALACLVVLWLKGLSLL